MMAVLGWLVLFVMLAVVSFVLLVCLRFGGRDLQPLRGWGLLAWFVAACGDGVLWWLLIGAAPFEVVIG